MKRRIKIGDRTFSVSLRQKGENIEAKVDGREYHLNVRETQRGVYSIVQAEGGGSSSEAVVQEKNGTYRVRLRDRFFEAVVERHGDGSQGADRRGGGAGVLKAVMPGRVVRLLARAGSVVRRGEGILVVEAMKMENEIGSPREGTVKKILVSPGDRVETGATLALIE